MTALEETNAQESPQAQAGGRAGSTRAPLRGGVPTDDGQGTAVIIRSTVVLAVTVIITVSVSVSVSVAAPRQKTGEREHGRADGVAGRGQQPVGVHSNALQHGLQIRVVGS